MWASLTGMISDPRTSNVFGSSQPCRSPRITPDANASPDPERVHHLRLMAFAAPNAAVICAGALEPIELIKRGGKRGKCPGFILIRQELGQER